MNSIRNYHSGLFFSFLLAIILMIMPLPFWANWFWPDWVLLVLIYWTLNRPQQVSLWFIFLLGLFVDILKSSPMGEHALIFLAISYFTLKFYARINFFSFWHKAFIVFALLLLAQILDFMVAGFFDLPIKAFWYWFNIFCSILTWCWLETFLRNWQCKSGH